MPTWIKEVKAKVKSGDPSVLFGEKNNTNSPKKISHPLKTTKENKVI